MKQAMTEIQQRAALGAKAPQPWSADELAIVRELYPDYAAMATALKVRSYNAIMRKARTVGTRAPHRHRWTSREVKQLAHNAELPIAELLKMFPFANGDTIRRRLLRVGKTRPKRATKATGVPLLDAIRAQARKMNLSVADLNAICKSGVYWSTINRRHSINALYVQRAVDFMCGSFTVTFPKEDS